MVTADEEYADVKTAMTIFRTQSLPMPTYTSVFTVPTSCNVNDTFLYNVSLPFVSYGPDFPMFRALAVSNTPILTYSAPVSNIASNDTLLILNSFFLRIHFSPM